MSMSTHRFARIRRFRFNLPQRIAAGLLALFLAQGLWAVLHQESPDGDALLLLFSLLPLAAGIMLGGALWWVTRRLFGNSGGYTALALYCFSPLALRASTAFSLDVLTALGIYGGVYTCIGVAHAMQGPRRKWRPRIVLLTAAFTLVALVHLAALPVLALLGLAFMLWVAEGRRRLILPVVAIAFGVALAVVFFCDLAGWLGGFGAHRSEHDVLRFSFDPAMRFFASPANLPVTLASAAALLLYLLQRRSRYFGNTAPLLCALILFPLVLTARPDRAALVALPFLLTFIGGVFADAFDRLRPLL